MKAFFWAVWHAIGGFVAEKCEQQASAWVSK